MSMTEKELKTLLGAKRHARMKTFAKKAKASGMSPSEIKNAMKKKFARDFKVADASPIISPIISPAIISPIISK
jgi:hypothetical protein